MKTNQKTVFYNGKIYLERGRFAEAMLVEDGKIRAVGTNDEIRALAGGAVVYDCAGKTVIPGLNDSHMHLWMMGGQLGSVPITGSESIDDLIGRCRAFIEQHPEETADGLLGMGWNQDMFSKGEPRIPNRHDLDRVSTSIPVVLERVCGHILTANTKAIDMLGLTGSSPQYEGGKFELGEDGFPNGVFAENACGYVKALIPTPGPQTLRRQFLEAARYAASLGVTSVQSNDLTTGCDREAQLEMLRDIYESGEGPIRYHAQVCFESPEEFQKALAGGVYAGPRAFADGLLTVGPLKVFKDGSLGARTAMMRKPYLDDPANPHNQGVETTTDREIDRYCALADGHDIQVCTHVIGDAAVEQVLNSYEKVLRGGKNPLRHSLVHCQITDLGLLRRIADMGVYVQYQPIFLNYDLHVVESRVGKEMASTSYAHKTLRELGGNISFGTDCPVEDCNPFENLYCAVARRDLAGNPPERFYPEECLDVSEAIDAYTAGSAACEFMENQKGRIREGYLADLVVLDRDIFSVPEEEIKKIRPLLTMVAGSVTYEANA